MGETLGNRFVFVTVCGRILADVTFFSQGVHTILTIASYFCDRQFVPAQTIFILGVQKCLEKMVGRRHRGGVFLLSFARPAPKRSTLLEHLTIGIPLGAFCAKMPKTYGKPACCCRPELTNIVILSTVSGRTIWIRNWYPMNLGRRIAC